MVTKVSRQELASTTRISAFPETPSSSQRRSTPTSSTLPRTQHQELHAQRRPPTPLVTNASLIDATTVEEPGANGNSVTADEHGDKGDVGLETNKTGRNPLPSIPSPNGEDLSGENTDGTLEEGQCRQARDEGLEDGQVADTVAYDEGMED